MNRRDFIRMSAAATTLMCGPMRLALAQQGPYQGPYLLMIEANGGWDPTSFCDPKGRGNGPDGNINTYDPDDIGRAGNIRYAPPPDSFLPGGSNYIEGLYTNKQFFDAHFQRLTVINGVDYATGSHSIGRAASWTGTRTRFYPAIGALAAAELAPNAPLPFIANGTGESAQTAGVAPRAIIRGNNLGSIKEIAFPDRIDVGNANTYMPGNVSQLVNFAAADRRQRQMNEQRLMRIRAALTDFSDARSIDSSTISSFIEKLENAPRPNAYGQQFGAARNLFQQAQVAFSAFESGAGAAAQIRLPGFDTHGNHDASHYPRLMNLLAGVDNIITDAVARGLGDNLVIMMASDFARTNRYNANAGKDHWSHGSVRVWAGPNFAPGNRVVGGTDSNQVSLELDLNTLQPDPQGVRLSPEYVHQAMRDLLGIAQRPQVVTRFPFAEAVLPIFA
mgnify:CR=1 FL=1